MSCLPPHDDDNDHDDEDEEDPDTRVTCDVLCSLGGSIAATTAAGPASVASTTSSSHNHNHNNMDMASTTSSSARKSSSRSCPKQHQLPMFLSKTYHMIDRCDAFIATWSASGDNFVVKDVEQFSAQVLPLYFKHSNFSSFARQLNFYGFRKLRTDPILTSDVDPSTACYVRFYHEKFQKDQPELLHQIKRATKSDQPSSQKDDVDSLKSEILRLKDCVSHMSHDMDRKLAEMSYEYNRRITSLSAEYDKLAGLVTQILSSAAGPAGMSSSGGDDDDINATTTTTTMSRVAPTITATTLGGNSTSTNSIATGAEMMQSLSHVAALRGAMTAAATTTAPLEAISTTTTAIAGHKRMAPDSSSSSTSTTHEGPGSSRRPKTG